MSSFDFCQAPDSGADHDPVENLGQVVFGERLRASPYNVCIALLVTLVKCIITDYIPSECN